MPNDYINQLLAKATSIGAGNPADQQIPSDTPEARFRQLIASVTDPSNWGGPAAAVMPIGAGVDLKTMLGIGKSLPKMESLAAEHGLTASKGAMSPAASALVEHLNNFKAPITDSIDPRATLLGISPRPLRPSIHLPKGWTYGEEVAPANGWRQMRAADRSPTVMKEARSVDTFRNFQRSVQPSPQEAVPQTAQSPTYAEQRAQQGLRYIGSVPGKNLNRPLPPAPSTLSDALINRIRTLGQTRSLPEITSKFPKLDPQTIMDLLNKK